MLKANKQDLSYVSVQFVDANNIPVPFADNMISFEVTGAGKLMAVGNGNQQSHTPLKGNRMEAWKGKCLAIIQSTNKRRDKNYGEEWFSSPRDSYFKSGINASFKILMTGS